MHLGFIEVGGLTKPRLGRHGKAPSPWGEGWGEGARSVLKCLAWNTQSRARFLIRMLLRGGCTQAGVFLVSKLLLGTR
jgi:hypothetical protein